MRSNVCKIEKGTQDQAALFMECEKVASYNGLDHKQALQLRLLCEEIDGMLPWLIEDFECKLWIDFEDGVCKVNVSIGAPDLTANKKEQLIAIAKNKRNAAAVGLVGKIRCCIEDFFLEEVLVHQYPMSSGMFHLAGGYSDGVDFAYLWSLDQYRLSVQQEQQGEQWDELEKSVLASVADDVTVGVQAKQVNITVVKRFA